MQRIIYIVLVVLMSTSCSVGKKSRVKELSVTSSGEFQTGQFIRSNLTSSDFFVSKATIEFNAGEVGVVLTGTIKYKAPDEYLISIRYGSIEAGRVYINADTVLINNRINRTIFYGKPDYISKKYGLSPELIPLLFGDFIQGANKNEIVVCSEGKGQFETSVKGLKMRYIIDCGVEKLKSAIQEGSLNNVIAEVTYDDFFKASDKFVPGSIIMEIDEKDLKIRLKIEKLETPWNGTIEFIPGNNYELRELK